MFGLSISEILLIGIISIVLFGNEKLPQNLKKFSRGLSKVRLFLFDMNQTWDGLKKDIKKNIQIEDDNSHK